MKSLYAFPILLFFLIPNVSEADVIDVTCPDPVTGLHCSAAIPPPATSIEEFLLLSGVFLNDDCADVSKLSISSVDDIDPSTFSFCPGEGPFIVTRTYLFENECQEIEICQQTFSWEANTSELIVSCPDPVAGLTCADLLPLPAMNMQDFLQLEGASISNNCSSLDHLNLSYVDDLDPLTFSLCEIDAPFVVTRTYTIKDPCGSEPVTCQQTFTWVADTIPPLITCPSAIAIACDASVDTSFTGIATATDNCEPGASCTISNMEYIDHEFTCFGIGNVFQQTFKACGNGIIDEIELIIALVKAPGDISIGISDGIQTSPVNVSNFYLDTKGFQTFSLAVPFQVKMDSIYTLTISIPSPGNICLMQSSVPYNDGAAWVNGFALAEDFSFEIPIQAGGMAPPPLISFVDSMVVKAGDQDTLVRIWTAVDACGNASSCEQIISLVDLTPAVVNAPASILGLTCNDELPAPAINIEEFLLLEGAAVDDACTAINEYTVASSDDLDTADFNFCLSDGPFVVTRSYIITDAQGNDSAPVYQMISWDPDLSAPVFTNPNAVSGLQCSDAIPAPATNIEEFLMLPGTSVSDNCTSTDLLTVSSVDDYSVSDFSFCVADGPFVITRTYFIGDACGNQSVGCTQTFTWEADISGPIVTNPASVSGLTCANLLPAAAATIQEFLALPGASAMDDCSAISELTVSHVDDISSPNEVFCSAAGPNILTRTYTISDACGNQSNPCVQTFEWEVDNEGPNALCNDMTVSLNANGVYNISTSELDNGSTDNCNVLFFTTDIATVSCADISAPVPVLLTAIDNCGNESSCVSTITVADNMPPIIEAPENLTINLASGECSTVYNYTVTANDNCDADPSIELVSGFPSGATLERNTSYEFFYNATDNFNNVSQVSWTVVVEENVPQSTQINCISSLTLALDLSCSGALTPSILLNGIDYGCFDDYTVSLFFDEAMTQPIASSPFVNESHVGLTIYAVVTSPSGNSCGSFVTVVDNLIPSLQCSTYEVACFQSAAPGDIVNFPVPNTALVFQTADQVGTNEYTVEDFDLCGNVILSFTENVNSIDCTQDPTNPFTEVITRIWTAVDLSGNETSCIDTINVLKASLNDITAPANFNGIDQDALMCDAKEIATTNSCGSVLGWNAMEAGDFNFPITAGHPSPADELYSCGTVKWFGTGFPEGSFTCAAMAYNFSDIRVNVCANGSSDGCYQIQRTWQIVDWCSGAFLEIVQQIKIEDDEGPSISGLSDLTISTDVWACSASYYIPDPIITDGCSDVNSGYAVSSTAGNIEWIPSLEKYLVSEIPIGVHTISVSAADCCGNETTFDFELTVEDLVPPTVVANLNHAVALTIDGTGKIYSETLDEGSNDACGSVWFKIIREEDLVETESGSSNNQSNTSANLLNGDDDVLQFGNQIYFDDFASFDCADLGVEGLEVRLRVFDRDPGIGAVEPSRMEPGGDLFGHFNDSWSTIVVQDNVPPYVIAPDDITVSCEYWFDINQLDQVGNAVFGQVITEDQNGDGLLNYLDRDSIFITDRLCPGDALYNPLQPFALYTTSVGIDGIAADNCSVTMSINVASDFTCGQGSVVRVFTATDAFGQSATATQIITIEDYDPFYINDDSCNNFDVFDGIHWPCDATSSSCGAGTVPEVTGEPILYNDDNCALISVTSDDVEFPVVAGACFTIQRTWTVTDWCQFDESDSDNNDVYDPTDDGVVFGQWNYIQYIEVLNSMAPAFSSCEDVSYCGYNNDCSGSVSLSQSISDDCTPEELLIVDFKIDVNNDGTYDYLGSNQAVYPYSNPNGLQLLPVGYSDNGDGTYEMTIGAYDYPVGTHRILWSAEDLCSNVSSCQYLFTVEDCKLPTPSAANGLAAALMSATQEVELSAPWFDNNSTDNCGIAQMLVASPSGGPGQMSPPAGASSSLVFNCDQVGTNTVDLWIEDIHGNWDYVSTYVLIQDNQQVCNQPLMAAIEGVVESELAEPAEEFVVRLESGAPGIPDLTYTNGTGGYGFPSLPLNHSYVLYPEKLDELRAGLTTLDLVLISRHLSGIEHLDSPYKIIAADVNNDGAVSAFDLLDLQKVILFIYDEFPNNNSFRFVEASHVFDDALNPFSNSFPEIYYISNLIQTEIADFITVKVGDVNNTAAMNAQSVSSDRKYAGGWMLNVEDRKVELGEMVEVDFMAKDFGSLYGFQFALSLNSLELIEAESRRMPVSFGTALLEQDVLTGSWGSVQANSIAEGEVLFSIKVKAERAGELSELISIKQNSQFVRSEAYGSNFDRYTLGVQFEEQHGGLAEKANFRLYQNQPNPFSSATDISFELPEAGEARLTIYDLSGKIVKELKGEFSKGSHHFSLQANELERKGVLFYRLASNGLSEVRKMVVLTRP